MAKKTEGGMEFSSSAYLVVPDPAKPSTWKLRIEESPGKVTKAQLGRAAAALGKGFRGNKVQLSSAERAAAMRKLRSRYKSMGVSGKDMPMVMQQSMGEVAIQSLQKVAQGLLEQEIVKDGDAEAIRENLEILAEMYLDGFTAMQNGTVSFETICGALGAALREYQQDPSTEMATYPGCCILATFPDTVVFEHDGKTYQMGYRMDGTEAVLEGDEIEVTAEFKPVPVTAQESMALVESIPSGSIKTANLNREQRIIEGTTLITGISLNGKNGKRRYPESTLKKIVSMAEGLPAYLNHVPSDQAFKPRPVEQLIGRHRNVRYDATTGSVKSDLHIAEHQAPLVFSLAEKFGDHIGNSLVSKGHVVMEGDTEVVKDIMALRSADLVSDPASTRGLFESMTGEGEELSILTLIEDLRKSFTPDPQKETPVDLAAILAHLKEKPADQKLLAEHFGMVSKDEVTKLQESIVAKDAAFAKEKDELTVAKVKAETELKESKAKNDKYEAEQAVVAKTAKLEEAIKTHDLGKKFGKVEGAISDVFKGTLMEADEKDWGKLLDDRLTSLSGVSGVKLPLSEGKDENHREGGLPQGIHERMARVFS